MAIKNNGFANDTNADRADRLDLLTANIDGYTSERGVTGDCLV